MENVMVPREPTEEMIAAGRKAHREVEHDTIMEVYKAMLAAAPAVEQEPVGAGDLDFIGAQFGLKFTDGCDNGCAEIYSEDDDNWFLQIRCDRIWLGDLADILQKAGVVRRLAHPSPPADKQAAQEGETPRTDAVLMLEAKAVTEEYDRISQSLEGHPDGQEADFVMRACDYVALRDWMLNRMVKARQLELCDTPSDIFEKCAIIGEDAMCACCWGDEANEAVNHVIGLIRAEALKVSAGGR